ncbi:MAG: Maf family protein [Rickettsiaceae bacterium]|nr:Maf family protein [Rickettsiaceae bacterium]
MSLPIILVSNSNTKLELLKRVDVVPDQIITQNITLVEKKSEKPHQFVTRISKERAELVAAEFQEGIIVVIDTIVVCAGKMLKEAKDEAEVRQYLQLLSGRRHRIYSAVTVIRKQNGHTKTSNRLVTSVVKFKRLSPKEIEFFCSTQQGIGKLAGYSVPGYAEYFISYMSGSFSNIYGAPLYETKLLIDANLY